MQATREYRTLAKMAVQAGREYSTLLNKNWLNSNKLSLNVIKTKSMFIESRQKVSTIPKEPNVVISENRIERVGTYKCLGLELHESWTWEYHISSIVSKVSKVLGVLKRLKPLLARSTLS